MELYERLKYLRKINGLTQQDTADHFQVSRQAIQKWEKGESAPDISKLYDLSLLYNLSIDVLLDNTLDDDQFKSTVVKGGHSFNKSSEQIINTITKPSRIDYILLGIVIVSTTLVLITLHIIGVIITILAIASSIGFTLASIYFLVNVFVNFGNGFAPILLNLGLSLVGAGLTYFLFNNIRSIITKYMLFTKRVTKRVQTHISVLRRLHYEQTE